MCSSGDRERKHDKPRERPGKGSGPSSKGRGGPQRHDGRGSGSNGSKGQVGGDVSEARQLIQEEAMQAEGAMVEAETWDDEMDDGGDLASMLLEALGPEQRVGGGGVSGGGGAGGGGEAGGSSLPAALGDVKHMHMPF